MKFKSLFLGMLGAAVMFSCNNEIDPNPNGNPDENEIVEGLPIYASMSITAGSPGASTYAGTSDVNATNRETQVNDVAMYIYKADASGYVPQCAVYLATIPSNAMVTMRTTSGSKKIFVAANPRTNPTSAAMTETTGFGTVSSDMPLSFLLNDTLYSTSATAFGKGTFATPAKTRADGLIVNFAMGNTYGDGLANDNNSYSNASARALMTNWDGPVDDWDGTPSANPFDGNATFVLKPDIDSVSSQSHADNHLDIWVQRQYAKISFRFSSSITKTTGVTISMPAGLSTNAFAAAVGQLQEGRFFPWGAGVNMYWSLGNIPTAQVPFQQYDNSGYVRDVFYQLTNDSLLNPGHFTAWTQHYDNNRVFPMTSMTSYPMPGLTVAAVKSNMTATAANRTLMTTEGAAITSDAAKFAYSTENARNHPVLEDHQTYAIVGGFYQPKTVITGLIRSAVETNGVETYVRADNFTWIPASESDTLYYIAGKNVFIQGKSTLLAYYAWVDKLDVYAGGSGLGTVNSNTLSASDFNQAVIDAINYDMRDDVNVLYCYAGGQCWYRVYLQNSKASDPAKKVVVARNHIYDVTISSIKGPGIADPNKIIKPGETVLELDTYVSATINVLNWHRVEQGVDVDNK